MTYTSEPATAPRRRGLRIVRVVAVLAVIGAVFVAAALLIAGLDTSGDPANAPAVFVTQPGFQPGAAPPCLSIKANNPTPPTRAARTPNPCRN